MLRRLRCMIFPLARMDRVERAFAVTTSKESVRRAAGPGKRVRLAQRLLTASMRRHKIATAHRARLPQGHPGWGHIRLCVSFW
jgi:hypothetical protein